MICDVFVSLKKQKTFTISNWGFVALMLRCLNLGRSALLFREYSLSHSLHPIVMIFLPSFSKAEESPE